MLSDDAGIKRARARLLLSAQHMLVDIRAMTSFQRDRADSDSAVTRCVIGNGGDGNGVERVCVCVY